MRATGETGREALESLGRDGRTALLELSEATAIVRTSLRAWDRGDLSTDELTAALRRTDAMDAAERRAYDDVLEATGDDTVKQLTR
ncbi:hypothetical protein [Halorhabdus sp. BNX81]|uniref:hypothetical protein n=1 Tax=Halorhabdus sp. BNX81 TaxID=2980181 RepID=UPI0023DD2E0C|nr:hypothetical protein [Halorhabdus sp. BNX81]WEL22527.1 hypothetical protein HBNXHr_2484 [Halorhabdus sp. BNX81]